MFVVFRRLFEYSIVQVSRKHAGSTSRATMAKIPALPGEEMGKTFNLLPSRRRHIIRHTGTVQITTVQGTGSSVVDATRQKNSGINMKYSYR